MTAIILVPSGMLPFIARRLASMALRSILAYTLEYSLRFLLSISLKNLKDYLSSPVIAACGGSYMVTADLIDNNKWDEITDLCKKSREIVKEVRG